MNALLISKRPGPARSPQPTIGRHRAVLVLLLTPLLSLLSGCTTIVNTATDRFASALSSGILNQTDEHIVRDGLPAYLLLVDGFIAENPENLPLLLAGAELYGSYAGAFVEDGDRTLALAAKARAYGAQALCLESEPLCEARELPHAEWLVALEQAGPDDQEVLYAFAASWATWIEASDGDWDAIADVPKVEAAMSRVLDFDPAYRDGWPHLYLGVLKTQLPPAYGGKPEEGRAHFEEARARSAGRNLMVSVLFAEQYARLVFDQELHDQLLAEVLEADVEADGLTLINVLAKARARELLAGSADYF